MEFLSELPTVVAQFPRGFEIIILLIIVAIILLIGPRKIPELARGIGKALGEFRRGKAEVERELKRELAETTPAPPAPPAETVVEISPRIMDAAKELGLDVLGRKERDLKVDIIKSLDAATRKKLEAVAKSLGLKALGLDKAQIADRIIEALGI